MICDSCNFLLGTLTKSSGERRYVCEKHYRPEYCLSLINNTTPANKQQAKADAGKPQLTLVPRAILPAIARVREYGCKKYGDPDNWRQVDKQRYRDALFRHLLAYLDDPKGNDEESGLPHLWHLACNVAFLCELEEKCHE